MLWISSILCVTAIASAHWLAGKVATRPDREQVRWASFGGGAGMAYVFVHLLPELASHGQALSQAPGMKTFAPTPITEALLFLIALAGIMVTYSLDVLATHESKAGMVARSLHTLNFAVISYLYAYSLPSLISTGLAYGILFTIAISVQPSTEHAGAGWEPLPWCWGCCMQHSSTPWTTSISPSPQHFWEGDCSWPCSEKNYQPLIAPVLVGLWLAPHQ